MPIRQTKPEQVLGAEFLVMVAKPFHRRLKEERGQEGGSTRPAQAK